MSESPNASQPSPEVIALLCGVTIRLVALDQVHTYRGLVEGVPTARENAWNVENAVRQARIKHPLSGHPPFLIPPQRRDYLRKPGDMEEVRSHGRIAEWLPEVTCIGEFRSDSTTECFEFSALVIVWFQNRFALPVCESVRQAIERIDWDAHAIGLDF